MPTAAGSCPWTTGATTISAASSRTRRPCSGGPTTRGRLPARCPRPCGSSGRPASTPSRLFADGGYAVMRSDWGPLGHQLILDAGPLGCGTSDGHGHADLLSIQVAAFGTPYLVDAGTYCYTTDREWRDFFRSTAAHSTVVVDGVGQAIPAGSFRWDGRPRARVRHWRSTTAFDLVDAEHDAYQRLPDPVLHRRRVIFVKP